MEPIKLLAKISGLLKTLGEKDGENKDMLDLSKLILMTQEFVAFLVQLLILCPNKQKLTFDLFLIICIKLFIILILSYIL